MTVHAIKIVASPAQESDPSTVPTPDPPNWIPALADRMDQNVLPDFIRALKDRDQPISEYGAGNDPARTHHARGVYHFDLDEDKASILDAIEADAVPDADWYVIRHHKCEHDRPEDDRTGGPSWTDERTAGTVPDGV